MKKNNIVYLLILLLMADCKNKSVENRESVITEDFTLRLTAVQRKNAGITVVQPELMVIPARLRLNGILEAPPQSAVSVSFPLGGYLKSTRLLTGMSLSKGDIIGIIEDVQIIQLQQDYLMAKNKLEYSEKEFIRQRDLNQTGAGSDKTHQFAKSEYENQKVLAGALGQKLLMIGINPATLTPDKISRSVPILSPVDGFVTKINVNVGKYTAPNEALFELVDPKDIQLKLSVFEKDVSQLRMGLKVKASTNDDSGKSYPAEIIMIGQNMDMDRSADVRCKFEKYDRSLLPGMYMTAEVELSTQESYTVPEVSVVRWEKEFYIFTEAGSNTFEMIKISPGRTANGFTEIGKVLPDNIQGKNIVANGAYNLLMMLMNKAEEE